MGNLKFRSVLICEDILQERDGRLSLLRILGSKLFVQGFPVIFPKLCIFLDWGEIDQNISVNMEITPPEGVDFSQIRPTAEIKGQAGIVARSMIIFERFVFPKPGKYLFKFLANGDFAGSETLSVEKFETPPAVTN